MRAFVRREMNTKWSVVARIAVSNNGHFIIGHVFSSIPTYDTTYGDTLRTPCFRDDETTCGGNFKRIRHLK